MKSSQGVGGIAGYMEHCVIKSVYAEGDISTRASNVGGIVGNYFTTSTSIACIKDVISKVDIKAYTDTIGGIVGLLNIPSSIVDTRNSDTNDKDSDLQAENAIDGNIISESDNDVTVSGRPTGTVNEDIATNHAVNDSKFMVAYDATKNVYTVVDVNEYLENVKYKSENDRVGIENLANKIKGNAVQATPTKDDQTEKGIWLYLVAVLMIAGGMAAFVPAMRKNSKNKRR